MGSQTPKQYLTVSGSAVISHSLQRLLEIDVIKRIVVALPKDDEEFASLPEANEPRIVTATGGAQRQESVLNGLHALDAAADDWVLVHDAVRPCVRCTDIRHLIEVLREHPVGGLLGAPVDHTLKQIDARGVVTNTLDRSNCWHAFTPQMFRYGILRDALEQAHALGNTTTDEAGAVEALGMAPQMVMGAKDNIKITHEADLVMASKILEYQEQSR